VLVTGRRPGHQWRVVEIAHPGRAVGEVSWSSHKEVRIIQELSVLDLAADPTVVEQQVEITDPGVIRFFLGQPDVAVGTLVTQFAQHCREDHGGHTLQRADVDAAVTCPEPVDRFGEALRVGE
jgi:hypothetical protein